MDEPGGAFKEVMENQILEIQKSQSARLFSILFSGPLFILWAIKEKHSEMDRNMMKVASLGVLVTVGYAYLVNRKTFNDTFRKRA